MSKRLTGWLNFRVLPRSRQFRNAEPILASLMEDVYQRKPDCILFSGDSACLGFQEEFALAARRLRVGEANAIPGIAVPGNHDYYTASSAVGGEFEKQFAPWLVGERIDGSVYPFARKVGHVWLIGVNSSTANHWFWDASGRVGVEQRDRLRRLLDLPQLADGPKILVTHYPIALANGMPEPSHHGLRDLQETLETARAGNVSLWLHGHRHQAYYHAAQGGPTRVSGLPGGIPSICAGSGTQMNRWNYYEYAIEGRRLNAVQRRFDAGLGRFQAGDAFALDL